VIDTVAAQVLRAPDEMGRRYDRPAESKAAQQPEILLDVEPLVRRCRRGQFDKGPAVLPPASNCSETATVRLEKQIGRSSGSDSADPSSPTREASCINALPWTFVEGDVFCRGS
jgi:hypothetical protein